MKLVTETSSARIEDGGHGFLRQGVAAQAGPREDTSGRSRRVVPDTGAVRGQGSLAVLLQHLEALAPLREHDWLPAHVEQAQKWHDAFLTSASRYVHAAAQQVGTWFEGALRDLYHLDRAEQAAAFIPERPAPVRHQKIPRSITQDGRLYELEFSPFRWDQDTPGMVTNRLATLAVEAMPDSWLRVTYVERRRASTYDPVIYAGYGDWYIKVAEWV